MEFKLLGPVEITIGTERQPTLERSRERCLLAVLLINAGQTLSTAKLISCIQDGDGREIAETTFRAYLSRVKRAVNATGGTARIVARGGGYQLEVPPDCVDVHRFTRLRHRADVAAREGNPDQAVALLCEAEALWSGPALADLDGPWADATRIGLEEERRACLLMRMGLELELGHHAEILGDLHRLSAQYPLDETCAGYEMTALYRSGRQADALERYRQMRDRLVEEEGSEPGPELTALHQQILRRELSKPDVHKKPASADRPGPDAPPEQPRSAPEAAYQALDPGEQRFFRFLGLIPGPSFTAESAAATAGVPVPAATMMIEALRDLHLIEKSAGGGFRLNDPFGGYAASRAKADIPRRERHDAERRMLDHYLYQADRADRDLYPHRGRAPLRTAPVIPRQRDHGSSAGPRSHEWLQSEWRNALKAAEYAGRHEWKRHCAELAHALAEFLETRDYWDEAVEAHSQALRACRDLGDQSWSARAMIDLSTACLRKGMRQEALVYAKNALDIYRSVGDLHGEAFAADCVSVVYFYTGSFRDALAYGRDARSLHSQCGDLNGKARASFHCGAACLELGLLSEGLEHFRKSLAIFERSGDAQQAARTLISLGDANHRQGYHREAIEHYRQALSIFHRMGAPLESAIVIQNIGQIYLYKGEPERAKEEFERALASFRQIQDLGWQARSLCDCGDASLAMEDYEQGLAFYQQAASAAEQVGDLHVRIVALRGIADAHGGSDRLEEAMRFYRDALELAQDAGVPRQHAAILDGIAKTMLRTGQTSAGRIHLRQARDLYRAAGAIEELKYAELRLQMLGDSTTGDNPIPANSV